MKPYYQDDAVTIYNGDCREIVPTLGRFDLICADPPYGKVKGEFDEAWTNRPAMLKDCAVWRDMMVGAMKPNATLYWFAWPSLAGRIEALIAEKLNPLAHIVWLKPTHTGQKACPESLRAPFPETERIIMAEHYGADNMARGDDVGGDGFLFEPIRAYLNSALPVSYEQAEIDLGWTSASVRHCFVGGLDFWRMPTTEKYSKLQSVYPKAYAREYGSLRKEYEDLRREYEDLRRFFDMKTGDQKTDVWRFSPETERLGHPTQKPLPLISYIVRLSCRPGGTILDPFFGSGTTGRAAKDLGRKCVGIEREERYAEIAAKRMQQECLQLTDRTPEPAPAIRQADML
jgi:site-specific DNA-methyltransferase (adenine-specific)